MTYGTVNSLRLDLWDVRQHSRWVFEYRLRVSKCSLINGLKSTQLQLSAIICMKSNSNQSFKNNNLTFVSGVSSTK